MANPAAVIATVGTGGAAAAPLTAGKLALQGAAAAGLSEVGMEGSTVGSTATAATTGGLTAGLLAKLGPKVSSFLSKERKVGMLKTPKAISDLGAKRLNKATPAAFQKAITDHGIDLNTLTAKYYPKGASLDDVIGTAAQRGKGGAIGKLLTDAENKIQFTSKVAGPNIRVSGDDIITALRAEYTNLGKTIGNDAKKKALKSLMAEVEKKYSNGRTVKQALETLRSANSRFGKAVLETEGDAVATAAQKIEANVLRSKLKTMFPEIAESLDTQAELYTLRPILERARGIAGTQGSEIRVGGGNILNQLMNLPDTILSQPKVASQLLDKGGRQIKLPSIKLPNVGNRGAMVASTLAGRASTMQPQTQESQPLTPSTMTQQVPEQTQGIDIGGVRYTPEMIQRAMIYDLTATGGKNQAKLQNILDAMQQIQKMQGGTGSSGVGKAAAKDVATARSGMGSLSQVESLMSTGKLFAKSLPGSFGARDLSAAEKNVLDAIARLRTGAAMTKNEEAFYRGFLPSVLDSEQVRRQKIEQLRSYFSDFANAEASVGITADGLVK